MERRDAESPRKNDRRTARRRNPARRPGFAQETLDLIAPSRKSGTSASAISPTSSPRHSPISTSDTTPASSDRRPSAPVSMAGTAASSTRSTSSSLPSCSRAHKSDPPPLRPRPRHRGRILMIFRNERVRRTRTPFDVLKLRGVWRSSRSEKQFRTMAANLLEAELIKVEQHQRKDRSTRSPRPAHHRSRPLHPALVGRWMSCHGSGTSSAATCRSWDLVAPAA